MKCQKAYKWIYKYLNNLQCSIHWEIYYKAKSLWTSSKTYLVPEASERACVYAIQRQLINRLKYINFTSVSAHLVIHKAYRRYQLIFQNYSSLSNFIKMGLNYNNVY